MDQKILHAAGANNHLSIPCACMYFRYAAMRRFGCMAGTPPFRVAIEQKVSAKGVRDNLNDKAYAASSALVVRCPVLTRMMQPSRLNGWCWLRCGLRSQLPTG